MSKRIPKQLKKFMLPFNWNVKIVWQQPAPIENVELSTFDFMFDLPFWSSKPNSGMLFDLPALELKLKVIHQ